MQTTLEAPFSTSLLVAGGVIATFAVVVAIVSQNRRRRTSKPLPPGPPVRWFWDNTMPLVNIATTFNEWTGVYGPVITLHQGTEIIVVITRVNAATEIMEKEGGALADRPSMIAANELLSQGKRVTVVGSGEHFRRLRKAIHSHFQPKAVELYKDIQLDQAKTLILDLLDDPRMQTHAHRFSASIVLRITYGKSSPTSINDPDILGVLQAAKHFVEVMRPGAYLVDRFPWLKYVPGYGWHLKQYYKSDLKFYREQLNRIKHAMSSEDASPSFSKTLLENAHKNQLSFDDMAFLAGTMYEAGSDTTANTMISMTMAAACFSDAQLRVQDELDKVVGMDRLPNWSDWNELTQLRAFIAEVLRWRPVTPLGVPHRSTRDIIWNDYCIPAGTTVFGNHWAISRDPAVFPDPEKFDPQRWLDQHGQLRDDLVCYTFGFGRRVCPGMHLATRSIFIGVALLLWSFRIVERPEAPIDNMPDIDVLVAHLAPFVVDYVPRINKAHIREMMAM